jgi:A/G-specific adenine glycosylase
MQKRMRTIVHDKILTWYTACGRHDLPWRHTEDLYKIVVSEVMLQQTNVPKVIQKYHAFLDVFPTWQALATASQADVLIQWRGLGYNRRALNLHKCAQVIVAEHDGVVPSTPDECMQLPGIGPYASRAVLAFGRNDDVAAVDVNIERLLRRWHAISDDKSTQKSARAAVQYAAEQMLPPGKSRDWHNALMDFASTVCTKRTPQCRTCPLAQVCPSYPDPQDYMVVKKKEPGRMEQGKHIPRRIYRGRIIEVLREGAQTSDVIGRRIKKDWEAYHDLSWLEEILRALVKEGMLVACTQGWRLK